MMTDEQDDLARLSSLKQVGELYQARKFREAVPIAQKSLELSEKALGPDHPDTVRALNNLAGLHYSLGDYAQAEPLYQRALKIREKALGPDHPDTAQALNNVAVVYDSLGDYAKAEPLHQRALKIREKALGLDHPDTAGSLNNLGELYRSKGDYAQAEPLYQRALKISEKALGPDHPDTGPALNNLAALYYSMGNYAKAEPLYQRALKISEKALGPDHPDTAQALNNLALLYYSRGDYAKPEPLYQRALKIREKASPDHPGTATVLSNLAELYNSQGNYAKAERLVQRALKIREKALGPDHPDTATDLTSLALLYRCLADYAKAEPLYQRALKIREKALGLDHPDSADALNNLAELYRSMADYAKAERLLQHALKIREKAFGPDHPDTALAFNNLAGLYYSMGDYGQAEPLFQRALKIDEKALGPDHPATATILNNLAELYRCVADYAKAERLLQRALKIREKAFGPDHPAIATTLNTLAKLYSSMGDYAKAEPLLQRALNIRDEVLGSDHPATATVLNNLAAIRIDLGDARDAFASATRAGEAEEKYLSNILSFTSEQQRLIFQKTTQPYTLFATLGSAAELAQTVLRQKGVVLDSLLEDRLAAEASGDPKQREVITKLRGAKQRLMQLVLEVPKDLSEAAQKHRAAEKERLSTEVEQLEGGLARQVAGLGKARRALSVTVPQIQCVLPKQAVLIELLRYSHYLGKGKFETSYGAVVIPARGKPEWVPLGAAAEIEKDVKLYQKSVRGETDEPTLRYVLKALEERVWAPIEKALPEKSKTVILSPDGELSFVSFATLLTPDDRFLGEKYSIRYVASGRDLLRETKPSSDPMTVVFANPDFDSQAITRTTGPSSAVVLRSLEMRALQSIRLDALPGTADEAAALKKRGGKAVKVFLGPKATEVKLGQVNSPRVLHLATHGFFLPETELGKQTDPLHQPGESPKTMPEHPMHRSGLALAGAQRTFNAWSRGEVPPIENDGIVTAEEVGGLKLNGTWLVVLSACDTGSGEGRAGEGVMGLRRGFVQAGGQNLLMTLWPISDETTVQIMLDFYATAEKTRNAPKALAEVQRTWLVKLRKEFGLSDAVELAGPFIMSSQGKPW
ncbi:MAG TPA: tetratricopeptide repeat protein [Chthoniobacterales bacterium]|nr:tetratricopeptide repeat protein [Chthoniobacterales bacterium]